MWTSSNDSQEMCSSFLDSLGEMGGSGQKNGRWNVPQSIYRVPGLLSSRLIGFPYPLTCKGVLLLPISASKGETRLRGRGWGTQTLWYSMYAIIPIRNGRTRTCDKPCIQFNITLWCIFLRQFKGETQFLKGVILCGLNQV
jgi:hypothetical protein